VVALTPTAAGTHPPRFIEGEGTPEWRWLEGARLDVIPALDLANLAARHPVAWVVAPHPDDEILGIGGLMARLADLGTSVRVASVTDGDASHPGSARWTPERLSSARARERDAALQGLDVHIESTRLGIADGCVAEHREELDAFVTAHCRAQDLLLTTWRLDGHPDHEACGSAVVAAAERIGARVIEYPVWAWHWASPTASEFPWDRARRIDLSAALRLRKRAAIGCFATQLDWDEHRSPVLPAHVLERFHRPFEVVFA
jgi:LmbE family N-acetylglucosaminyl deacetylase